MKFIADFAPVDAVINLIRSVHEQEKLPKRREGVKWKKSADMMLHCAYVVSSLF